MDRAALLRTVSSRLGDRRLVWAGLRADDIEPLTDLPQTAASFSIVGAYRARRSIESLAHEDLTGIRVDLDAWDIDDHLSAPATQQFRRSLLSALARPSAMVAYRPSRFLSAIWFARQDRCLNLSLFGAHQAAFEHKPWVETAVASLGLPRVPWIYVADEERRRAVDLVRNGPLMLRCNRGSGGAGMVRVDSPGDLERYWPEEAEAFIGVAPFLDAALPINVGATVWVDGVTVHHPSVQLIGIPNCVTRPFGYCGNDFGAAAELPARIIDQIERSTVAIGGWLRSCGYLGTFGVDFLVHDGEPLFTEVNARFQGSTATSCRLSIEDGEACLVLEHVAAMLALPAPKSEPLYVRTTRTSNASQIVVHWTGGRSQRIDPSGLVASARRVSRSAQADVTCRTELVTEPGGVVARLFARDSMSSDGFRLAPAWQSAISDWTSRQIERPETWKDDAAVRG